MPKQSCSKSLSLEAVIYAKTVEGSCPIKMAEMRKKPTAKIKARAHDILSDTWGKPTD
jgi:hypothetical protein